MPEDDKIPGRKLPYELIASDECIVGVANNMKGGGKPDFTVTAATIRAMSESAVLVAWETVSAGFGEVTFYRKGGKLHCDSESMGRDFVKAVLAKLVDGSEFD